VLQESRPKGVDTGLKFWCLVLLVRKRGRRGGETGGVV